MNPENGVASSKSWGPRLVLGVSGRSVLAEPEHQAKGEERGGEVQCRPLGSRAGGAFGVAGFRGTRWGVQLRLPVRAE